MSATNTTHTICIGTDYQPEETGYGPCNTFELIEGNSQLLLWEKFSRSLTPEQEETLIKIHEAKQEEDRRFDAILRGDEAPLGHMRQAD